MDLQKSVREAILTELMRQAEAGDPTPESDTSELGYVYVAERIDLDALIMVVAGAVAGDRKASRRIGRTACAVTRRASAPLRSRGDVARNRGCPRPRAGAKPEEPSRHMRQRITSAVARPPRAD
jgi:hypothetical protein